MKNLFKSVALASGLTILGLGAAVSPSLVDNQAEAALTTKQVYTLENDEYGHKIISTDGVDQTLLAKIIDHDPSLSYITIQNVFDPSEELTVDRKYLTNITIKNGLIIQATIDGTSPNFDEVYKVVQNKDVVVRSLTGTIVYGQDIYTK